MGSCSSLQRTQQTEEKTTMKLNLSSFASKANTLIIPPSPVKPKNNETFPLDDSALNSHRSTTTTSFTDYDKNASKEEAFFDSKAWLDSDCEDDFYSVKGEFTPSRGTTPVHHSFATPVMTNTIPGSAAEPSPTERKKKLLELFRESIREHKDGGENNEGDKPIIQDFLLSKSANSTPYFSETNSAGSAVKSKQRCLPSLVPCRSFSERRRKGSPGSAIAANGKA
ncbi:uncharacterized protein At3g27210-like [Arachis stenosperma]|uniref:uncharacterized protein At3g27210-like n=1 Tax=Arachis stenosperma TaxID=217475 RepID=UPI0025AC10DA|nr:uncharacterized protein At3g27210-like [Arachis stenosperma]